MCVYVSYGAVIFNYGHILGEYLWAVFNPILRYMIYLGDLISGVFKSPVSGFNMALMYGQGWESRN